MEVLYKAEGMTSRAGTAGGEKQKCFTSGSLVDCSVVKQTLRGVSLVHHLTS